MHISCMYLRPYQKLVVWKEAHQLCLMTYATTKLFPSDERFGLVSQMRRSSSSVPTNIAEGNAKKSNKEKEHFFEISKGSLEELHYQCLLSLELHYISKQIFEDIDKQINKVSYLLSKIRSSLR